MLDVPSFAIQTKRLLMEFMTLFAHLVGRQGFEKGGQS